MRIIRAKLNHFRNYTGCEFLPHPGVNVLLGDMSFVGPRPERRYFIEKIREKNPNYDYVYLMRPGLTSMATLHNGYTDTMEKMLKRLDMDLEYLQKRSLWLDAKLIFTTFLYIVNGKKF